MSEPRRLVISFSGGETSAFMAQWLLKHKAQDYDEVVTLFANTGQEHPATLDFVERCDREFGLDVVWLEAVVNEGRVACTHRVVDYESADREGRVFEAVIAKYGIPNKAYPHCTRELKLHPMRSYLRSIGWTRYESAVGIRYDEIDRMQDVHGIIYPLIAPVPMTKPEINRWWRDRPWRLPIKGYEGNCRWCWKKSDRKLLTLARETPEVFDFPRRMEANCGLAGHNIDGTKRVFFRENKAVEDIFDLAASQALSAVDDSQLYEVQTRMFDYMATVPALDEAGSCAESCEAFI